MYAFKRACIFRTISLTPAPFSIFPKVPGLVCPASAGCADAFGFTR
jgi:hypothetical protein